MLVRRLRKSSLSSPANKDIRAFDLFESWQTNPVGLLRAARTERGLSLSVVDIDLLLLCILLGVRDFSREKQTTIAPGRPEKKERKSARVFVRTLK